jgi:Ni,Fe-hydrogenase III small subunit
MGILLERIRQKHRTMAYPDGAPPELPARWIGEPDVDQEALRSAPPADYCPTGALQTGAEARLDLGRCIFCGKCASVPPEGAVTFSRRYAMGRFRRDDLILGGGQSPAVAEGDRLELIRSLFGKSLKLRQVSAGGCNACEADCNVLGTLAWDMSRFGIAFVASPRHADGILVTGPVTENMKLALEKTYAAVPTPKVVVAVGACAVSGGLYGDGSGRGVLDSLVPVDLYIPGCPPHPLTILEGLLRLQGRVGIHRGNGGGS